MKFLNKYHENPNLNRVEFVEIERQEDEEPGEYSHLVRIVPTDGATIEKPIFTGEIDNHTTLESYVDQLITDAGLDAEAADE